MDHAEKARALFLEGYNCAQAVLCAFDDLTGLDRETSARLASWTGRRPHVWPLHSAEGWDVCGRSAVR